MQGSSSNQTPSTKNAERQWRPPKQFGNYLLEKEIDGGGMGIIYKGYTISDQKTVAIKFLLDKSQHKRFQREVDTNKRLKHPNFVRCHDTGEVDEHFFIVMDFIDGQPLKKYMEKVNLSSDKRLELFHTIVEAVAYAHDQGIIHRDLKPANILINQNGDPIILDFGLAKYIEQPQNDDATALTIAGQILGTPGYMSPEQARGEIDQQDTRSDIFSLGVILYEMLTARNPFDGSNFLEICYNIAHRAPVPIERVLPGIPPQLAYICNKALAKEKEARYQKAKDFADDIKSYMLSRKNAKDHPTISLEPSSIIPGEGEEAPLDLSNIPSDIHSDAIKKVDKIICTFCGSLNPATNIQCQSCGKPTRKQDQGFAGSPVLRPVQPVIAPPPIAPAFAAKRQSPTGQIPQMKPPVARPSTGTGRIPLMTSPAFEGKPNIVKPPILLTPDKEVSSKAFNQKSIKWQFISGAILMPISMMPVCRAISMPFYGYLLDIIFGGIAEILVTRWGGGAHIGCVTFSMACVLSYFFRYFFQWMPYPFSSEWFGYIFLGILLASLLGVNLGLLIKKYRISPNC